MKCRFYCRGALIFECSAESVDEAFTRVRKARRKHARCSLVCMVSELSAKPEPAPKLATVIAFPKR